MENIEDSGRIFVSAELTGKKKKSKKAVAKKPTSKKANKKSAKKTSKKTVANKKSAKKISKKPAEIETPEPLEAETPTPEPLEAEPVTAKPVRETIISRVGDFLIREAGNKYTSTELAERFSCRPIEVHRAVSRLERFGYGVEAVRSAPTGKRGRRALSYTVTSKPDLIVG